MLVLGLLGAAFAVAVSKFGVGVICLGAGFALGRVKNKAKLAAVSAVVSKYEAGILADAKLALSKVKAAL